MPSTMLIKRLAGKEDIRWDADNTDAVDQYGTGGTYPVTRVNAKHIPLGPEVAALYEKTTVAQALSDIKADLVDLEEAVGSSAHLQQNVTIDVAKTMTFDDINDLLANVPSDLNGHTLTVEFPNEEEAQYDVAGVFGLVFNFRNGRIMLNLHDSQFNYTNVTNEGVFTFERCSGCDVMVYGGVFNIGTPSAGQTMGCGIFFMCTMGHVFGSTFTHSGTATVYGIHYAGCVGWSSGCTYTNVEPFYLENDGVDTSKMAMLDENGKVREEQLPDAIDYGEAVTENSLKVVPGKGYVWEPPADGTLNFEDWPTGSLMQFAIVQIDLQANKTVTSSSWSGSVSGLNSIAAGMTNDCVLYSIGTFIHCVVVRKV